MKHVKLYNEFITESVSYTDEKQIIVDALSAFNKKFNTKLSDKSFELTDSATDYKYFWTNSTAGSDIKKLKASGDLDDYTNLELYVKRSGSKYKVVIFKAAKLNNGKSTQALFSFPE